MTKELSPAQALRLLKPGMTVFLAGCSGEPTGFVEALYASPEHAAGVTFVTSFIPACNPRPLFDLTSTTRHICFFPQRGGPSPRCEINPLNYSDIPAFLEQLNIDLAIVQTPSLNSNASITLGPSEEFTAHVMKVAKQTLAILNSATPKIPQEQGHMPSHLMAYARFDHPLRTYDVKSDDETADQIIRNLLPLIPDNPTLQIGLGAIPAKLCEGLDPRAAIKFHTGALFGPGLTLLGKSQDMGGPITASVGIVAATPDTYASLEHLTNIRICGVETSHNREIIGAIERFIAVNSALSVDLTGAVNSEFIDGRRVSSPGGLRDFTIPIDRTKGGLSIIALPAKNKRGEPRIVTAHTHAPTLDGTYVDIIVTEFGIADLRGLTDRHRRHAIGAIAAPEHRGMLDL